MMASLNPVVILPDVHNNGRQLGPYHSLLLRFGQIGQSAVMECCERLNLNLEVWIHIGANVSCVAQNAEPCNPIKATRKTVAAGFLMCLLAS